MSDNPAAGVDPAAFLANLVRADVSATQALGIFRAQGLRMGNETFYGLYSEIREAVGGRSALQGMHYNQLPTGSQYTEYQAGPGGQYATFVQTYTRGVGDTEVSTKYFTFVSNEPHTANEAIAAAQAQLVEGQGQSGPPGGEVMIGSTVSSMTVTTAYGG